MPLPLAQKVMQLLQSGLYRSEGSVNKLSADDKGITFVAALQHLDNSEFPRGRTMCWFANSWQAALPNSIAVPREC